MARCKPKRSASLHRKVARAKARPHRAGKHHAKLARPSAHLKAGHKRPVGSGHVGTGSRCLRVDHDKPAKTHRKRKHA